MRHTTEDKYRQAGAELCQAQDKFSYDSCQLLCTIIGHFLKKNIFGWFYSKKYIFIYYQFIQANSIYALLQPDRVKWAWVNFKRNYTILLECSATNISLDTEKDWCHSGEGHLLLVRIVMSICAQRIYLLSEPVCVLTQVVLLPPLFQQPGQKWEAPPVLTWNNSQHVLLLQCHLDLLGGAHPHVQAGLLPEVGKVATNAWLH